MKSHNEILRICSDFNLTQHEIDDLFFKLKDVPNDGDEVTETIAALAGMKEGLEKIKKALKTIERTDPLMYERFHQDEIDEYLREIGWWRHIEASKVKEKRDLRVSQWYIDRSSGTAKPQYMVQLTMMYSTRRKQSLGLFKLAQFWIEHHGKIPKTRGHEFFKFSGKILWGDEVSDAAEKAHKLFRDHITQVRLPSTKSTRAVSS